MRLSKGGAGCSKYLKLILEDVLLVGQLSIHAEEALLLRIKGLLEDLAQN